MNFANRPTRLAGLAAATAAAALVLAACGGGPDRTQAAAPAPAVAPAVGAASVDAAVDASAGGSDAPGSTVAQVPAALKFTAATVSGGTVEGASFLTKPTVAWFWAPWCSICRKEAPAVAAAQAEFGDRINFVGIAGRGPVADMARFVSDTGVGGFEHVVDADGGVWSGFKVLSQPAFAFVHPDGTIEMVNGSLDADGLSERIAGLMHT
jgi:thiol-disulfide isomerase/thioredoxin